MLSNLIISFYCLRECELVRRQDSAWCRKVINLSTICTLEDVVNGCCQLELSGHLGNGRAQPGNYAVSNGFEIIYTSRWRSHRVCIARFTSPLWPTMIALFVDMVLWFWYKMYYFGRYEKPVGCYVWVGRFCVPFLDMI